jgi:Zn-dependent alcohol dehydrogenases, class III
MKAAYFKAPFQFEIRSIGLREIKCDEVLVKVKACSVCGHDMIMASYAAVEWQPFGHEISGIVEKTGCYVKNVKKGDKVVLESGTFDRKGYPCVIDGFNVDVVIKTMVESSEKKPL